MSAVEAVENTFLARGRSFFVRGEKVTQEMSTKKGRNQQPTKLSHHGVEPRTQTQERCAISRLCFRIVFNESQRTRPIPCETCCEICG